MSSQLLFTRFLSSLLFTKWVWPEKCESCGLQKQHFLSVIDLSGVYTGSFWLGGQYYDINPKIDGGCLRVL
jgi:hypothetical protein